jgi:hypothetical protein
MRRNFRDGVGKPAGLTAIAVAFPAGCAGAWEVRTRRTGRDIVKRIMREFS